MRKQKASIQVCRASLLCIMYSMGWLVCSVSCTAGGGWSALCHVQHRGLTCAKPVVLHSPAAGLHFVSQRGSEERARALSTFTFRLYESTRTRML